MKSTLILRHRFQPALFLVLSLALSSVAFSIMDTDGDGLSDEAELIHGTDPMVADTDGDGLSDGEEVLETGTSPLEVDTDGDALTDWAEERYWQADHRFELIPLELPACDDDNSITVSVPDEDDCSGECSWASVIDGDTLRNTIKMAKVVCFEPGDYTSLGNLILSGAVRTRVLRPTTDFADGEHPVNFERADRATLLGLYVKPSARAEPMDFVVSGLAFSGLRWLEDGTKDRLINLPKAERMRPVFDRLLLEDATNRSLALTKPSNGVVVQRSVLHRTWPALFWNGSEIPEGSTEDRPCIGLIAPSRNARFLYNEFADCAGDGIIASDDGNKGGGGHLGLTIAYNDFFHTGLLGAYQDPDDEDWLAGVWLNSEAATDWLNDDGDPYQVDLDSMPIWQPGNRMCAENAIDIKSVLPMDYYDDHLDDYRSHPLRAIVPYSTLYNDYYALGLVSESLFDPELGYVETGVLVSDEVYQAWVLDYIVAKSQAIVDVEVPEEHHAWILGNRYTGPGRAVTLCSSDDASSITVDESDTSTWMTNLLHHPNSDYVHYEDNIVFDSPVFFLYAKPTHYIPPALSAGQECDLGTSAGYCIQNDNATDGAVFNQTILPNNVTVKGNLFANTTAPDYSAPTIYAGAFDFQTENNVFFGTEPWLYYTVMETQAITCNIVVNSQTDFLPDKANQVLIQAQDNAYYDIAGTVALEVIHECYDDEEYENEDCDPYVEGVYADHVSSAGDLEFTFPRWTQSFKIQRQVTLENTLPSAHPTTADTGGCSSWSFEVDSLP